MNSDSLDNTGFSCKVEKNFRQTLQTNTDGAQTNTQYVALSDASKALKNQKGEEL